MKPCPMRQLRRSVPRRARKPVFYLSEVASRRRSGIVMPTDIDDGNMTSYCSGNSTFFHVLSGSNEVMFLAMASVFLPRSFW